MSTDDDTFCPHANYPLRVTYTLIESDLTIRHVDCGRPVVTDWPYLRAHELPLELAYVRDDQDETWLELRARPDEQSQEEIAAELVVTKDALNAAYRERAHLVALLAAVYPSHVGCTDPDAPGWAVVTIQLPTGQAAWHIAPDGEGLFQHVEQEPGNVIPWDGHTTEEKYQRIDDLTARLWEAQQDAPDEQHFGMMAVPRVKAEQPQDERDMADYGVLDMLLTRDRGVLSRNEEAAIRALLAAQNKRDARIAELERELRDLRGTELNPSPMVLDAQAYGELRDEIAATMGDGWDLDEAEISILVKYVRWLAAGQPRDEDGHPVRHETYPAAESKPDVCVCGDPNCMPYWRPVHEQMNAMRLKSDKGAADFTKAMLEEICELRTELEKHEAAQDKRDGDVRADAFDLDCEELVEIFTEFIGEWDRSHEVITVGLPDHLPQLRIPHLRRAVVALQRLGRERDAALKARDGDVRAVAALLKLAALGGPRGGWLTRWEDATAELQSRFADRITALEARDAKAAVASAPVCESRVHPDFAGDKEIQCELPDGHAWHRNGERTWTP